MAGTGRRDGVEGRRAALVIALTGVFWIGATFIGGAMDLPQRWRALFDLIALAGFVMGLVMTYRTWRVRQRDKD